MNNRRFKLLFLTLSILVIAGFAGSYFLKGNLDLGQPVSAKVKEIEGYRSWTKVNSVPQSMPMDVAQACAIAIHEQHANSPHGNKDKYFTVYVNDTGREAMTAEKFPKFPEGSVIVKEKLSDKNSTTPELMTVMIKQKNGSSPETGDWEYMVTDGNGEKIEGRGKLANCQACHAAKASDDYIFRTYLDDGAWKNLK